MKVRFKKLDPIATTPQYSKPGDAGIDLVATSFDFCDKYIVYGTGISIEIPKGHVGHLVARSSVTNHDLILKNSIGIIDSNYRGELMFRFMYVGPLNNSAHFLTIYKGANTKVNIPMKLYQIGERIGQIIITKIPTVELVEVEELSDTTRGEGGFGSTGK